MNERCSTVLLNELPSKEKDLKNFTIPCQVLEKHKEAEDDVMHVKDRETYLQGTKCLKITFRQTEVTNRAIKCILERSVGYNPKDWLEKLNDALWAFRTAYKTPTGCTPFRLVYGKGCHLPVEIEHKAHWALKQCNMDLTLASESRLMQLNELAELRDGDYENTRIYKEWTKKWHDSRLRGDKDFKEDVEVIVLVNGSNEKLRESNFKGGDSHKNIKANNVTIAGPKAVVSAAVGYRENVVTSLACWIWRPVGNVIDHTSKDSGSNMFKRFDYGNPQYTLQDQGIFDSGCSRHMTGNKSFLTDYKEASQKSSGHKIAQFGGPPEKVDDKVVHKELGNRMERAATTASSLEAEQDSVTPRQGGIARHGQ
ncbi:reverse transcriptase domain-containing protein [Tanacetum coccineum]